MADVSFKFDNKDVVIVRDAATAAEAYSAAERLLKEISEDSENADYALADFQAQYLEESEDGTYEFRVVCSDK